MTLFIRSIDSKTNWADKDRAAFEMRIFAPKIFYTELSPYIFFLKKSHAIHMNKTNSWLLLLGNTSFAYSLIHSFYLPHWTHLNVMTFCVTTQCYCHKIDARFTVSNEKGTLSPVHKTNSNEKCKRTQVIGKCDSFMVRRTKIYHMSVECVCVWERLSLRVCACVFGHVFDVFGIHKFQNNALYE